MSKILKVKARQVFDSRGNPTLKQKLCRKITVQKLLQYFLLVHLLEHLKLMKKEIKIKRYLGKSVFNAVNLVNSKISKKLKGQSVHNQERIDILLLILMAQDKKQNLGANAILAVSMALKNYLQIKKNTIIYKTFFVKKIFNYLIH